MVQPTDIHKTPSVLYYILRDKITQDITDEQSKKITLNPWTRLKLHRQILFNIQKYRDTNLRLQEDRGWCPKTKYSSLRFQVLQK